MEWLCTPVFLPGKSHGQRSLVGYSPQGCKESGMTERLNNNKLDEFMKKTCVCVLVAQSCPTLCDPVNCSPPGSSIHGDSPGKNTGVDCHTFLQGIFPSQGSNPGLPLGRQILYCLSHQESPIMAQTFKEVSDICCQVKCHQQGLSFFNFLGLFFLSLKNFYFILLFLHIYLFLIDCFIILA